jgi:hypothetical protein
MRPYWANPGVARFRPFSMLSAGKSASAESTPKGFPALRMTTLTSHDSRHLKTQTPDLSLLTEPPSILTRDDEGFDHFRTSKITVEAIKLIQPEVVATVVQR